MSMQTVSLSQLVPSKANPRKAFDATGIEGLAASIKTDGLLQNLVVKPVNGKGERFSIVTGERRYRALKLLEERGELPEHLNELNVEVRESLTKEDSLRIATVENLQRQNLTPLEEAAALAKLIRKGATLEDVAAQTGLSPSTIKRRLALGSLCKRAQVALREGKITLSQAEALTLGSHDQQENVLESIEGGYSYDADEIKDALLDDRPSVAMAIFPMEQYTGTITTDLFGDEENSYFDDAEQFLALQKAAVEKLAEDYRSKAAWVEVTERYGIADWQYDRAGEGEPSGVLINLSPSGKVEVREGLAKSEIDEDSAEQTAGNVLAPKPTKASYPAPLRRYIAHHKSMAVQELLLANARKAKEVLAFNELSYLKPHECVLELAESKNPQVAYKSVEAQAAVIAGYLGLEIAEGEPAWKALAFGQVPDDDLYEAIKCLTDHQLDAVLTFTTALRFGQDDCNRLDCGESLFNKVALDLEADMKNHWRPDRAFLERRSIKQLVDIGCVCGYADGRSGIGGYKKVELVNGLLHHFENAHAALEPNKAQAKALAWLPEVMQFPAIDPDAQDDEPADD